MKNRLFFLLVMLTIAIVLGACESEAPLEPQGSRVDTLIIYDSTFIIDTTVFYDTVFSYDSVFVYDTTVFYDTIVSYDTTIVYDSLVVYDTTFISDTLWTIDTVIVYDSSIVYDSLFVYDTTVFYDTLIIYDSTTVYDTVVIIDSVIVPDDQDSLVYQDCLILKCNTRAGTLGQPGYFVTVSRQETNGHPIKFCLYVYRQGTEYVGILSATHLKTEWPTVKVKVEATNNDQFYWWLDKKHQTLNLTF